MTSTSSTEAGPPARDPLYARRRSAGRRSVACAEACAS